MKIALHLAPSQPEVRFARDLGLRHVVSGLPASPSGVLELEDLRRARAFFDAAGLSFDVIENLPVPHYDKAMFGLPGRDEQIEKVSATIRNMGAAGIGVLQYQWMLLGGLRTEYSPTGRGGSRVARFDLETALRMPLACQVWRSPGEHTIHAPDRELSSEEVWANLLYFLKALAPVAEEAGVKLAVHPDDPPIPSFMGVARIMTSLEAFQRLIDSVPSPCIGLGFCQGTISAIPGVGIPAAIRRFGRQGKIFFAHFRNSIGTLPRFDEVFPDEGDTDMLEAALAYREVGFDGLIRIDHTPGVAGDSDGHCGFAHQVGYAKALDHALDQIGSGMVRQRLVRGWHVAPSGSPLQLALTVDCFDDVHLMMAQQMGVDQLIGLPKTWDVAILSAMKNRVEKGRLKLAAIDGFARESYARAVLGLEGRDAEIEALCAAIHNAGAAGVPLLSYAWPSPGPGEDGLWENLGYFLRRVLPVAELAGVRLACRPDLPHVEAQGSPPRILWHPGDLARLAERSSSPSHGVDLCLGTIDLRPGVSPGMTPGADDAAELIARLAGQRRIFMLRLDTEVGSAPGSGDDSPDAHPQLLATLLACKRAGFAGPIRVAHPPRLEGDDAWGRKGRACDLGYVRALMQVVERMG